MTAVEVFCMCQRFIRWYTTDAGIEVCHCGHPRSEHIDNARSCVGDSVVTR